MITYRRLSLADFSRNLLASKARAESVDAFAPPPENHYAEQIAAGMAKAAVPSMPESAGRRLPADDEH